MYPSDAIPAVVLKSTREAQLQAPLPPIYTEAVPSSGSLQSREEGTGPWSGIGGAGCVGGGWVSSFWARPALPVADGVVRVLEIHTCVSLLHLWRHSARRSGHSGHPVQCTQGPLCSPDRSGHPWEKPCFHLHVTRRKRSSEWWNPSPHLLDHRAHFPPRLSPPLGRRATPFPPPPGEREQDETRTPEACLQRTRLGSGREGGRDSDKQEG